MKKNRFWLLVQVLSLFAMCLMTACSKTISPDTIAQIEREETYPATLGQLEVNYFDLSEIIADATVIVRISVSNQSVVLLDGLPQTHTTVRILEVYKGNLKVDETIEVVEEGGQDNKVMGGILQMQTNNEYVLFLTKHHHSYYICGAFQGRFILREGYVFQQATEDVKLTSYSPLKLDEFARTIQDVLSNSK